MAPAYANIFMGGLESKVLSSTNPTPKLWKRYIDYILKLELTLESLHQFIDSLNQEHPRITFTSEISSSVFLLDLCLYKGERFGHDGI